MRTIGSMHMFVVVVAAWQVCSSAHPGDSTVVHQCSASDGCVGHPPRSGTTTHSENVLLQAALRMEKAFGGKEEGEMKCHTAVAGDDCFNAVTWAMTDGCPNNPHWYPGLECGSSFEGYQRYFHDRCASGDTGKCQGCAEPCGSSPGPSAGAPTPRPGPPPSPSANDYDEGIAVTNLWMNQAVAEIGNPLTHWTCFACQRVAGVSNVRVVEDHNLQTLGIVANYNSECLVAFRGSKNQRNWDSNAMIGFVWHPDSYGRNPPCYRCQIHQGYSEIWEGLKDGIKSNLQSLGCGSKRVQVTGHSMGGAIAVLAAWDLIGDSYDVRQLYTFGEAVSGNSRWVDARKTRFANVAYYRITHYKDEVPLLHRKIARGIPGMGYHHAGPEVYYYRTQLGSYTVCEEGEDSSCQSQWCPYSWGLYHCDASLGRQESCDHCSYLGLNPCHPGAAIFQCRAP